MSATQQLVSWLLQCGVIAVASYGTAVHLRIAAITARRAGEPQRADRLDRWVLLPFAGLFCLAPAGAVVGVVTIVRGWWA